jgi:hypothetical protein
MDTLASAYASLGSGHLLLTPTALWMALCVWSCLEVGFYLLVTRVIHPRLEPHRQAPMGPLPPRETLTRLVDTLERLKEVHKTKQSKAKQSKACMHVGGWVGGCRVDSSGLGSEPERRRYPLGRAGPFTTFITTPQPHLHLLVGVPTRALLVGLVPGRAF